MKPLFAAMDAFNAVDAFLQSGLVAGKHDLKHYSTVVKAFKDTVDSFKRRISGQVLQTCTSAIVAGQALMDDLPDVTQDQMAFLAHLQEQSHSVAAFVRAKKGLDAARADVESLLEECEAI